MTKLKLSTPSVGELNTLADPKIVTALKEIETVVNGELEGSGVNIKAKSVDEGSLTTALTEKLTTKLGFKLEAKSVSFEAETEKHYVLNKAGITCTLPAPTANRIVSVWAGGGFAGKVTASSGKIYGDFVEGATTVELLSQQHVIVIADGSNWEIIAGQPKLEGGYSSKTYSQVEMEAGVELSATRPAIVTLQPTVTVGESVIGVSVGGQTAGAISGLAATTIWLDPGKTMKSTIALNTYRKLL